MVERLPGDFPHVLHIHVVVHHHDHLAEHRLPHPPEGVHDLAGMPRVSLAHRHQDQVVENPLGRHADVRDLRQLALHDRQEDPLDGLADVVVLHGRRADDGGLVDRIPPAGDAGQVEHRVLIRKRIIPGVVAEGALGPPLLRVDVSLQDDLGRGGDLDVDGHALHHRDGLAPHETGEEHLVHVVGEGRGGGEHQRGVGADGAGDLQPPPAPLGATMVVRSVLVDLPVHRGRGRVEHLHAIDPAVALAGLRITREHERQGDVSSAVLRPALDHGQ